MNKNENKKNRKVFIEETIGTRKYFSYRADLLLYKVIISFFLFIVIYFITSEFLISTSIAIEVLFIFTLINKLNLERKEKEGKEILLTKIKKEYFKNKLNILEINNFERLIKYYFKKQGLVNYKKIGNHIYSSNDSKEIYYIKVIKLNDIDIVEKIDIRNYISLMYKNKIKNGFLVTPNEISEDVKNIINKTKEHFNIKIINEENIFEFAVNYNLLPDDEFFYTKIHKDTTKNNNIKIKKLKSNTINNKKIIIYIFAAILFYSVSALMPYNNLSIYLSYSFVILTIVSSIYLLILKVRKIKVSE